MSDQSGVKRRPVTPPIVEDQILDLTFSNPQTPIPRVVTVGLREPHEPVLRPTTPAPVLALTTTFSTCGNR
jgi:hypothetical protein